MMVQGIKLLVSASVSLGALCYSSLAFAQDERGAIDEIVVTAEKRESTAQKTPIAMSVLDSEAIQRNGVSSLTDLATLAPSLNFAQNSVNTIVTVRGVSSRDTTEISDPAISISTDGFYYQRPFALNDTVYDLERVEVLRGPQGTLYGRNATGGAINFITARPDDYLSGSATVGLGNYNLISAEGYANVPLSDTLTSRASFYMRKRDGFRTNNYVGKDGDDADAISVRLQLLFRPTDRLSMRLVGQTTSVGGVGPTYYGVPLSALDPTDNNSVQPELDKDGQVLGPPRQSLDGSSKSLQLSVDYDLDFATVTYLGGWRNQEYRQLRDLDGLAKSDQYFLPSEDAVDWQHELRLSSNGDTPFRWQTGLFYFHEKNELLTNYSSFANPASPGQESIILQFYYPKVIARSKAAFAQASYEILSGLRLEGGIRYSDDFKSRTGCVRPGGAACTEVYSPYKSDKVTYHLAANWQLTPDNLLYVKRDTGYKSGGFTALNTGELLPYTEENIVSYEIGSKNRLFDNRLELNLSAYHYDYKDQQISTFDPVRIATIINNAGKSRVKGVELELVAAPVPELRIDGSIAYTDAKFTEFLVLNSDQSTTDFAGNRPPNAPKWTIGGGIQYDIPVGGGTLTPRLQTHIESKYYLGFQNFGIQEQDGYSVTDLMLTYAAPDNSWSLQGYVRNIENTMVLTAANTYSSRFQAATFQMAPPTTYGARLTVEF